MPVDLEDDNNDDEDEVIRFRVGLEDGDATVALVVAALDVMEMEMPVVVAYEEERIVKKGRLGFACLGLEIQLGKWSGFRIRVYFRNGMV
ncbi:hypothetical protein L1987_81593 [Smallanthus sonchifolius]|uniref:Uncharacterized protein n=1 Tax=Smallanthus sonchifolius TaxID=185202 RepID=A0ACB8YQW9_9ASTR|nr:hypothetical protein L1987_81593 [Smallanthus sonchifolius]